MQHNDNNVAMVFETSWEVCNKIGGIYTVLSTKAKTLQNLYKDKVNCIISEEIFSTLFLEYSKEKERLVKNLDTLTKNKKPKTDSIEIKELVNQLLKLPENNINKNLLLKLIDKIEIDNKNQIKIFYNFSTPRKS